MQRYFLNGDDNQINKDDAHHIKNVMRMKIGDQIEVCYDNKRCYLATITDITDVITFNKEKELISTNKKPSITLVQGLPKSDKAEIVTKYGTQFGVSKIIFTEMTYSIAKMDEKKDNKKIERLQKIAIESARLAHRNDYPQIIFEKNIKKIDYSNSLVFLAYEQEKTRSILDVLKKSNDHKNIVLIIGPEGGISPKELEYFEGLGAYSISLGDRIMQTEIAAIYALSVIDAFCE